MEPVFALDLAELIFAIADELLCFGREWKSREVFRVFAAPVTWQQERAIQSRVNPRSPDDFFARYFRILVSLWSLNILV
jgi:hypothetical protein